MGHTEKIPGTDLFEWQAALAAPGGPRLPGQPQTGGRTGATRRPDTRRHSLFRKLIVLSVMFPIGIVADRQPPHSFRFQIPASARRSPLLPLSSSNSYSPLHLVAGPVPGAPLTTDSRPMQIVKFTAAELRLLMFTPCPHADTETAYAALADAHNGPLLVRLMADAEPGFRALLVAAREFRSTAKDYCVETHFTEHYHQPLAALIGPSGTLHVGFGEYLARRGLLDQAGRTFLGPDFHWDGSRPKWEGTFLASIQAEELARLAMKAALSDCARGAGCPCRQRPITCVLRPEAVEALPVSEAAQA
jgi:hypothetical protein